MASFLDEKVNHSHVIEIKERDLYQTETIHQNLYYFNTIDLGHDDKSGHFKQIKSLSMFGVRIFF